MLPLLRLLGEIHDFQTDGALKISFECQKNQFDIVLMNGSTMESSDTCGYDRIEGGLLLTVDRVDTSTCALRRRTSPLPQNSLRVKGFGDEAHCHREIQ